MTTHQPIQEGDKFEKLTVISEQFRCDGRSYVLCRCQCGKVRRFGTDHLKSGHTRSCRCATRAIRHGHASDTSRSPTYQSWAGMKQRCLNPKCREYKNYGGRGITICPRWIDSFEAFLTDMGEMPEGKTSIDRYPNCNGNYEPENCRWANAKEQNTNTRATILIEIDGQAKCLKDWCRETGIKYTTARHRIKVGMNPVAAITFKSAQRGRWNCATLN